jgi:hypothetical protein
MRQDMCRYSCTHDVLRAQAASHHIPEEEEVQAPTAIENQDETAGTVDMSTSMNVVACAWEALATHKGQSTGFARVDGLLIIVPVKFAGHLTTREGVVVDSLEGTI